MNALEQEILNTQLALESGVKLETTVGDDGLTRSTVFIPEPKGFYADGEAPTMRELGVTGDPKKIAGAGVATLGGMAGGAATGLGGIFADLLAMGAGPQTQEAADELKAKYGTEALRGMLFEQIDALDIPEEYKFLAKDAAMVGEITGLPGVAAGAKQFPKVAGAVGEAVSDYAAGAPQRIADRTSGTMFGAGMDPTAPIDEAIVAGQKLLKEGKGPTAENPVAVVPPTETEPGVIAFHGSGADFDQFSLEKIGTGEGNQAYGYGLYFTDSEDIAKFYRDTVSQERNQIMFKGKPLDSVYTADILEKFSDDIPEIVKKAKDMGIPGDDEVLTDRVETILAQISQGLSSKRDAREAVKSIRSGSNIVGSPELTIYDYFIEPDVSLPNIPEGKMYKVGLAPKPEDMIDYQTTFADQPQKVQDALKAIGYEVEENIDLAMRRPMPMVLDSLKGKIIGDVREGAQAPDRPDKILSEKLLEQGIPGIKYRAAGSRAANIDAADAEMNYVIFDDKAIKILEKYGIVGPVAVTAIAGAQQQEGNDNGA